MRRGEVLVGNELEHMKGARCSGAQVGRDFLEIVRPYLTPHPFDFNCFMSCTFLRRVCVRSVRHEPVVGWVE